MLQATVEIRLRPVHLARRQVAQARPRAQVDEIGQGRVWDGGTARQLGLVDQFGGLDDALEWAAKKAKLKRRRLAPGLSRTAPDRTRR